MLSVDEALSLLLREARVVTETETVATLGATGRVLAAAQSSTLDVPPMDNSAMDGYAIRVADATPGPVRLRIAQRIAAGDLPQPLAVGTAARSFAGAPIPAGADAIVMQEFCTVEGDDVLIGAPPRVGHWIRKRSEDIQKGGVILQAGRKLQPQDIGLAASVGLKALPVLRRLKVAMFFTGSELVMPGDPLPEGAIYNSNRFTLTGLLQRLGCEVRDLGIVPDNLEATRAAFREAAIDSDLIITSGGMSVGEEDHVKPAVEAEGRLDMWRIAMKPGKPLAFGFLRKTQGEAAFIGLPGNPVSTFICFLIFVRPYILRAQGVQHIAPLAFNLPADFDWPQPDTRREFLRARINAQGRVELFPNQGSAVLSSCVWADGMIDNPPKQPIA
ncbi:MAG TPA: gephyrin-like molybdotransferase Glp, partial [Burkholderiales bacterium]|nr:gephyrin-like molybdotransferase Glp [Burkholderiales bacterium]